MQCGGGFRVANKNLICQTTQSQLQLQTQNERMNEQEKEKKIIIKIIIFYCFFCCCFVSSDTFLPIVRLPLNCFCIFFFDMILFIDFNNAIKKKLKHGDLETPTNNFIFFYFILK